MEGMVGRTSQECDIGALDMNYGKGYLEKGSVSIWIIRILSGFLSLEGIASQLLYVYALVKQGAALIFNIVELYESI
ncbi:MAG: hypothetical protein H5U29_14145 [Pusillimonas sp.]|nr:hypothetical protein [Pusillimonas sp.]